jgi:hypothetical protein
MSSEVLLSDVAKAAGVAVSTVSLVLNGKGDKVRIRSDTQARIRNLASQMGYQPHQLARDAALGRGVPKRSPIPEPASFPAPVGVPPSRMIGLVFSAISQKDSFALLPDVVSLLVAEDYRLAVLRAPVESPAVREGMSQLLAAGCCGVLCCPTLYAAVVDAVAGRVPVIVLWQGGAKALLAKITGVAEVEVPDVVAPPAPVTPVPSPPSPSPAPAPAAPVVPPPIVSPEPAPPPVAVVPPPVAEEPQPVPEAVIPEPVPEPIPVVQEVAPAPVVVEEQSVVPEPVIVEPVPISPAEPVTVPEVVPTPVAEVPPPVAEEPQPVLEVVIPEPAPEPIPMVQEVAPDPVVAEERSVVPEPITVEPVPISPPESAPGPVLVTPSPEIEVVQPEPEPSTAAEEPALEPIQLDEVNSLNEGAKA